MAHSASEVKKLKRAPQVEGVLPVILERWSARSYSNQDVPLAEIEKIFEAVRWTASARNEQPWRFIVGRRNSQTYEKIVHAMMAFTRPWASTAPVLVLCLAKTRYSHDGSPNPFHQYDLGAAATTFMLQATWQGLCTRTLGSLYGEELRKSLAIPGDYAMGCVIALGYQGDPAALQSAEMIAAETATRARKTVNDLVYSKWGEPFKFA